MAPSPKKYWDITPRDVYVRVFDEIFDELDLSFFPEDIVKRYQSLSLDSKHVLVRLYYRSLKWISSSEMEKYLPPEKLKVSLKQLSELKWLLDTPTLEDQLEAATMKDLQPVASDFGIKTSGMNRTEIIDSIRKLANRKQFFGASLGPKISAKFQERGLVLYILNTEQTSTLGLASFMFLCPAFTTLDTVVRSNMKMINFVPYAYYTQKEAPIFPSKAAFMAYYNARVICDPLEEAKSLDETILNLVDASLLTVEPLPGRFSAAYVLGRAITLISHLLGKAKRFQEEYIWVQRYLNQKLHTGKRAEMYIRKLLLELKFYSLQKDTSWLHKGLNTYFDSKEYLSEIEKFDMDRKVSKLISIMEKEGLGAPPLPIHKRAALPIVEITAVRQESLGSGKTQWGLDTATSVEEAVLLHYQMDGWEGGHFENGTIKSLFALLCYDLIFLHKDGFRCRFQSQPMGLQKILNENKNQINERVNSDDVIERIETNYKSLQKNQPQMLGVHWDIPLDALVIVAKGLGPALGLVLERLASNYGLYGSGLPDLTLWKEVDGKSLYRFVEVKSENDTVSDNQYVWMELMLDLSINFEICRVLPKNSKQKKTIDSLYPKDELDLEDAPKKRRTSAKG